MSRKFLRHKTKGTIYNYNELTLLDSANLVEVVTEEEAFPERFQPKATKGRKSRLTLEEVKIEEPDPTPPSLAEEAAEGWPK